MFRNNKTTVIIASKSNVTLKKVIKNESAALLRQLCTKQPPAIMAASQNAFKTANPTIFFI